MAFKESEHPRDKDGKFTDGSGGKVSEKEMIHALREAGKELPLDRYGALDTLRLEQEHKKLIDEEKAQEEKVSGAISGALNPSSERAQEHAERYYRSLKKRRDDVAKVSRASGYSEDVIQAVKSYLFIDEHDLGDKVAPFYPDYDIAESWRRLSEGKPFPHDILLVKHEVMEMSLIKDGLSQQEAHNMTNKKYNYREAVDRFNSEREKNGKSK